MSPHPFDRAPAPPACYCFSAPVADYPTHGTPVPCGEFSDAVSAAAGLVETAAEAPTSACLCHNDGAHQYRREACPQHGTRARWEPRR